MFRTEIIVLISIALLINLGLLFYVIFYLNKTKKVVVFSLFILSLCVWQINDLMIRFSPNDLIAFIWNETTGAISGSMTAFSFHFALIYTGKIRNYYNVILLWISYLISFIFIVLIISPLASFTIEHSEYLGRIGATGKDIIAVSYSGWVSLLAVFTLTLLVRFTFEAFSKEIRMQSKLIAFGFTIPAILGIALEYVVPMLFNITPLAISSATSTIFSISVVIALKRYRLFDVSGSQLWRNLENSIEEGIVITDLIGRIKYCNRQFQKVSGYRIEELEGRGINELIADDSFSLESIKEVRLLTKDGNLIWAHLKSTSFINLFGKENGLTHVFNDISEKKYVKKALKESEEKFHMLIQTMKDAVVITNYSGQIVFSNASAAKLFDISRDKLYAQPITSYIRSYTEDNEYSFPGLLESLLDNGKYAEIQAICTKDKRYICDISFTRWNSNEGEYYCFVIRDITEKSNSELTIRDAISSTQDQERSRIAREIHDGLGQLLIGAKLHITALLENCEVEDQMIFQILEIQNILEHSITEARNISHHLMPVDIERLGFREAVHSLCDRLSRFSKINFNVNIDYPSEPLVNSVEMHLYRIIQEFLSNTIKYADATNLFVVIVKKTNFISLELWDDGKGTDIDLQLKNSSGIGIKNIFNRIAIMNGKVFYESGKNKGLYLKVKVPVFPSDTPFVS